jgi:hypothetical protein
MYNNTWDAFFGNPVIGSYLTEAEVAQEEQLPEQPESETAGLDQIKQDFDQGIVDQNDLVQMYKTGKLTQDDIASIISPEDASGQGQEEQPIDPETGEPVLSEEELFAQQIDQTNDMFVKFSIYDKIGELQDKLDFFQENFDDIQSDTYQKVVQLKEFLNILSSLVFSIETTVAYQMYGSLLLQLTEVLTEYNQTRARTSEQKKAEISEFRSGEKTSDAAENWGNDNKSDLIDQEFSDVNDHGQTNE